MKLTLPQQDIYFEQLLYPNEPIYNIGAKIEIKGSLHIQAIKKAYVELINQHDAYRMVLIQNQEEVEFKILDEHQSELGFVDFSDEEHAHQLALDYMQTEFIKPFDLNATDLLHRFILVKVGENFHYLFSVYHHIITDGWGTSLMFQRLVQNYNEILTSGVVTTAYPYTYQAFVEDDISYQHSDTYYENEKYWLEKYHELPDPLFEKLDKSVDTNRSKRKELFLKRKLYNRLIDLSKEYKASTFHVILGILFVYFGRKHQNSDFAIGLPVLNRSKRIYKKTVGLFMGVSPLRIQLDFDDSFQNLVASIKHQLRVDYRHHRFPLGKMIQSLQLFKTKEKLFNLTLSYEKQNYSNNFLNTKTKVLPLTHEAERVALALYIREFDEAEDVKIDFDYNINYFDDHTISQVVDHFQMLIAEILVFPQKKLKEFKFLTAQEQEDVLVKFNRTYLPLPNVTSFIDLFKDWVKKNPNQVAIRDDYDQFTYKALDHFSNQIATCLIDITGNASQVPIGVQLERSANLIAILLGIMKSGNSYIPLDPGFPKERIRYIGQNSQMPLVISTTKDIHKDINVLLLKDLLASAKTKSGVSLVGPGLNSTAYIIYTSGSTGNPKGVEIGHASLLNFLVSIQQKPGIQPKDLLFSVTTPAFDISILEFFGPLIAGATTYISTQNVLEDLPTLLKKIETICPTIIQATPSFYQMLFHANWKGNDQLKILCGGDLLSEVLAAQLLQNCRELWNMYGPTETTIWSSIKKIEKPQDAANIGKPIHNTSIYLLDKYLAPVPKGSRGAIFIGGKGLAKGYYRNQPLTQKRFIENPLKPGSLIYDTGDIGQLNSEMDLIFLGRNDYQVKIRGFRIELGEIETRLNELTEIKEAVVIAKKGKAQEDFLVAYVSTTVPTLNTPQIMTQLRKTLPEYMIPNVYIPLQTFPLTPNKKLDRKHLAQREVTQNAVTGPFKAPLSPWEITLVNYWKQILEEIKEISIQDDFFRWEETH